MLEPTMFQSNFNKSFESGVESRIKFHAFRPMKLMHDVPNDISQGTMFPQKEANETLQEEQVALAERIPADIA